jgi:hypothetical protein
MPPGLLEPPDAPTADIPSGVEKLVFEIMWIKGKS